MRRGEDRRDLRGDGDRPITGSAPRVSSSAATRATRLRRGERHTDVEEALAHADKTRQKLTLAVFDEPGRGNQLLTRLNQEGRWAGDALRACKEGAHAGGYSGHLGGLVKRHGEVGGLGAVVNDDARIRLNHAEALLDGTTLEGAWPRCAAWLIRLALKHALIGLWQSSTHR